MLVYSILHDGLSQLKVVVTLLPRHLGPYVKSFSVWLRPPLRCALNLSIKKKKTKHVLPNGTEMFASSGIKFPILSR
jgi:hypothetical protein